MAAALAEGAATSSGCSASTSAMVSAAWRPLQRLSAAALNKIDLHASLGGLPAVVELPVDLLPIQRVEGGAPALLGAIRDIKLDLRPAVAVARSGGAFHAAETAARPTVDEWLHGAGSPLVFDTKRQSDLHCALRSKLNIVVPSPLREWSRSPIATLGRPGEGDDSEEACSEPIVGRGGLAFHRHERNWLYLATGCKRWYFHAGGQRGSPATAFQRVDENELCRREAVAAEQEIAAGGVGPTLLTHVQRPGECLLLPDGLWHCTYNILDRPSEESDAFVVGFGGMGACVGDVQYFAASGDTVGLETALAKHHLTPTHTNDLARIACEQSQPQVLAWLQISFGSQPLLDADEKGTTPLHFAAAAGCLEATELLLKYGAEVGMTDMHGATATHWLARSGCPQVLAALVRAGADVNTPDETCACTTLHLLAAEGHLDALRWAVENAGGDLGCMDEQQRTPYEWAVNAKQKVVASWIERHC